LGDTNLAATVSFWAKGKGYAVSTEREPGSLNDAVIQISEDGRIDYYVDSLPGAPYIQEVYSNIAADDPSGWNFYSLSMDGARNTFTFTINEKTETVSFDSTNDYIDWDYVHMNIEIGRNRNYTYSEDYFLGSIDNVLIYNYPRSPDEVRADYSDGLAAHLGKSGESWGLTGYSYRKTLTIHSAKVPNADQADFPVLVSLTDAALKTKASGGKVQSGSGYDIVFTAADKFPGFPMNWRAMTGPAAPSACG
jgi:hypothetical protein